jgi:NTE family protein
MANAASYAEWLENARAHDEISAAMDWRRRRETRLYDYASIDARLKRLRKLRRSGDDRRLLYALNEGIHGNMGGMGRPALYRRARSGTKTLISDYIDAICDSLAYLASPAASGIPLGERLHFFQRASHCYGRSALMLSGGGTLGYFHFGVLKALIEQQLCPQVISGASAGAFVAAVLGTRSDEEYLALFRGGELADELTANRNGIKLGFFRRDKPDVEAVKEDMTRFIPNMTFIEAYEKTGRAINITISPAEPHQTSRLLNHIASPNVTILSAVMASAALPGVFPPVQLQARNDEGEIEPYLPMRRWIDGSLSQDLPAKRLARLYGVNHFVVSQVMPGLGRERVTEPGLQKTLSDASVAATKQMLRGMFDALQARRRVPAPVGSAMNMLNGLIDQRFTGDINIFPGYGYSALGKVLRMLDREEMLELFRAGERATWPKLPMIECTTRIGRCLDRILHDFEAREEKWLDSTTVSSRRKPAENGSAARRRSTASKQTITRKAG